MIGAITAGLFGAGVPPVFNSYESIATVTVGSGGSSTVSFSSIPSTYKHLQVRYIGRDTRSVTGDTLYVYANADSTGSNYYFHIMSGNGSTASAQASGGFTGYAAAIGQLTGANATSGMFGAGVIDILDYASTSKNKTFRGLTGQDTNGAGITGIYSNLWLNSSTAISGLTFRGDTGDFAQYTQFALYGIKG